MLSDYPFWYTHICICHIFSVFSFMSVYSLWFLCISFRKFVFTLITLELLIFIFLLMDFYDFVSYVFPSFLVYFIYTGYIHLGTCSQSQSSYCLTTRYQQVTKVHQYWQVSLAWGHGKIIKVQAEAVFFFIPRIASLSPPLSH